MHYVWCICMGYLVGGINPAYLVSRQKGFDIRSRGSGNAGGSNAFLLMGKLVGISVILFDIFKAFFIVRFAMHLFAGEPLVLAITGTSVILGHIFPLYLGFRGGKGLAALGGVVLAYDWRVFCAMLAIAIVLALVCDYIFVISITAPIAFFLLYGIFEQDVCGALILMIVAVTMFFKHLDNIRRVRQGVEVHLSYIWNKDAEEERVRRHSEKK